MRGPQPTTRSAARLSDPVNKEIVDLLVSQVFDTVAKMAKGMRLDLASSIELYDYVEETMLAQAHARRMMALDAARIDLTLTADEEAMQRMADQDYSEAE